MAYVLDGGCGQDSQLRAKEAILEIPRSHMSDAQARWQQSTDSTTTFI